MASSPQNEPTMEEILASIRKIISEDSPPQDAEPETPAEPEPAPEPAPGPETEPEADPEPFFAEEPTPAETEEEDLLELTPEMEQETSIGADDIAFGEMDEPAPEPEQEPYLPPEPEPEPLAEPEPLPEEPAPEVPVAESSAYEPEPEPEQELSVPDMNMMTPPPASESDSMFSEKSRRALDAAMANLDRTIVDEETAQRASNLEQTVGSIMLNAMREKVDPAVNRWLSENRAEMIAHMKPFVREWLDENFPALLEEAVRSEVARTIKLRSAKS